MDPVTSNSTFALPVTRRPDAAPAAIVPPPPPPVVQGAPPKRREKAVRPLKSYLDEYLGPNHVLSAQQQAAVAHEEMKLLVGPTSRVPMLCGGLNCPFISHCPLAKNSIPLPIQRDCPVEAFAVDSWKTKFLNDLELDKQEHSASIVALVDDLAVEVALQTRILWKASMSPDPIMKNTVGMNFQGDPLEVSQLNPILDFLLRTHDRKLKKLRELLVTPRSKAEAGRLGFDDPASKTANAQSAAAKILKEMGDSPATQIAKLGDFTKRGSE